MTLFIKHHTVDACTENTDDQVFFINRTNLYLTQTILANGGEERRAESTDKTISKERDG